MQKHAITRYATTGETLNTFRQCGKQFFKSSGMSRGKCYHCGKRRLCDIDGDGEYICAPCKAEEDIRRY